MPRAPKAPGHARPREPWVGHRPGSTRAWRTVRAVVLTGEPVCRCGAPAVEAGHIVPVHAGGTDERGNLTGQCAPCNRAQIYTDRVRYPT